MPILKSLDVPAFLGQDISRSFWNGKGSFELLSEPLIAALEDNPAVTLGAVRARLRAAGKPLFLQSGIAFSVDGIDPLRLGAKNGSAGSHDVKFSIHGHASARIFLVFSSDVFAVMENEHPADLGALLRDHTRLESDEALVVIAAGGDAGADFAANVLNGPTVSAGVSFGAGAGVDWVICRPARDSETVLDALRDALAHARLPQSVDKDVVPRSLLLDRDELYYSAFVSNLRVGATATLGYSAKGTTNYQVGKLDLATELTVKADAELSVAFGLTGAFRILALAGSRPGCVRVVVQKQRTSTFDVGVGVTAEASWMTAGLPDDKKGAIALLESILGFQTPQVARQVMQLAKLPPDELRKQADATIRAFVATHAGQAFDQLNAGQLATTFATIANAAQRISNAEDSLLAIYEKYVGERLDQALQETAAALSAQPGEQRQVLIEKVTDPQVRRLVTLLTDGGIGQVLTSDAGMAGLKAGVDRLRQLVTSDADQGIRKFLEARTAALGLDPLFNELKRITTVPALKARTLAGVDALVERLTGTALDRLFASSEVTDAILQVNKVAKEIDSILMRIADIVRQALNNKGRFEFSCAYQRVREGESLVDIEIEVGHADPAIAARARDAYRAATHGRFEQVLDDANAAVVTIGKAAFTDVLKRSGTLNVQVFGWNYQEVNTVLLSLESTVKPGPTGTVTVYSISAKKESVRKSRRRTVALSYLFQVAGQVNGAFEADATLRAQLVDAFATLSRLQTSTTYAITDPMTSLDELRQYFGVGQRLNVLSEEQVDHLMDTIDELRRPANGAPPAIDPNAFRRVGVTYTMGFDGAAFARALSTNLTGQMITWWGDRDPDFRTPVRVKAKSHLQALQSIYVERLIASRIVGRTPDPNTYGVAALYAGGAFVDFLDQPVMSQPAEWRRMRVRNSDGKELTLNISNVAFANANRHYFVNQELAKFLSKLQSSMSRSKTMKIGEVESTLEKIADRLGEMGEGDDASFPFMMLDELVRRANPGVPDARRALLEITLFDAAGKPVHYIPIAA